MKLAADLVQGEKFQPAGRVVAEGSLASDSAAIALELTDLVLDRGASPLLLAAARWCGVPGGDLVDSSHRLQQLRTGVRKLMTARPG